ncbi:ribonuclease 3 [Methyloglobulus morosus KoM1]|uniref:Ribonuclease 3 n=1 Tax=Methyloglobulus morosus KoM1 TaxID=1116472 RepID=V5BWX8_9GAMM|nr:ribonuclease III [Methyloglobulus morosus]ESS72364.1 ribonuclease 3 [Methyloglobulus morosus KoM1]
MTKKPEILSQKLGLTFNKPQLFVTALTHRSVGANNNERLEFLGDAILGCVIAQKLYDAFPSADEGTLSRLRASLVNESSLADLARQHCLGDYLLLGSGELKSGGFRRDSILSDALEGIIGALFKDQGIAACEEWIGRLFAEKLHDLSANNWQKDPKTQLQELMQAKKMELPDYALIDMSGLPHEQTFKVRCSVSLIEESCIGTGVSRKKAEQSAAEMMLAKLQQVSK